MMSSCITIVQNGTSRMKSTAAKQNGCSHLKKPKVEETNGHSGQAWRVIASRESHECVNPVRSCEEIYFKEALEKRDKSKELIKVSIGESCLNNCGRSSHQN